MCVRVRTFVCLRVRVSVCVDLDSTSGAELDVIADMRARVCGPGREKESERERKETGGNFPESAVRAANLVVVVVLVVLVVKGSRRVGEGCPAGQCATSCSRVFLYALVCYATPVP